MADDESIDLPAFRAGDRETLNKVYWRYVSRVEHMACRYCRGPDAECVTQDVFLALVEKKEVRAQFAGGDLGAWLCTMAARRAIDLLRRRQRCVLLDSPVSLEGKLEPVETEQGLLDQDQARQVRRSMDAFAREVLPRLDEKLARVFEARFQQRLSQKAAARALGVPRSTFIDHEVRLLRILAPFLKRHLGEE